MCGHPEGEIKDIIMSGMYVHVMIDLLFCVQVLESGNSLSRKNIVLFVVQRLSVDFPQASKTSIGHGVQLRYRAACFNVSPLRNMIGVLYLECVTGGEER